MPIPVKLSQNKLHIMAIGMWPSAPLQVYLLIPQNNGYLERWLLSIEPAQSGKSVPVVLPVETGASSFSCAGLRLRTTAMPENTGRVTVLVMRDQDPAKPPHHRRDPAEELHIERMTVQDPLDLKADAMVEVES